MTFDAIPLMKLTESQFIERRLSAPGPNAVIIIPDLSRPHVTVFHWGVVARPVDGGYLMDMTAETLVCAGCA